MQVGEIIKKLRKSKGLTLLELSQESGVALATLSRIENGKMTGTLDSHMNICKAFEMTLPELYRDLPSSKKTIDVQKSKAKHDVYIHDKKSSSEILASNVQGKKMMPVLVKIVKGGQTPGEESKPGVEKFIYILDGKVEANIGNDKYSLTKGDTLYFESSIPHYFRNAGPGEAELLSIASPPLL